MSNPSSKKRKSDPGKNQKPSDRAGKEPTQLLDPAQLRARQTKKPPLRKVETPEWGARSHVFVAHISARDFASVRRLSRKMADATPEDKESYMMAGLCLIGCRTAKGERLFKDGDLDMLMDSPLGVVQRCAGAIEEVSGLSDSGPRLKR